MRQAEQPGIWIFKSKWFAKFAKKERISDAMLCAAVYEAEAGNVDADYGGGVIKQRVARTNQGKSGGYRTILLYRHGKRAFFVFGFAKKDQANLSDDEVQQYKEAALIVLAFSDEEVIELVSKGIYEEIECDGEETQK